MLRVLACKDFALWCTSYAHFRVIHGSGMSVEDHTRGARLGEGDSSED